MDRGKGWVKTKKKHIWGHAKLPHAWNVTVMQVEYKYTSVRKISKRQPITDIMGTLFNPYILVTNIHAAFNIFPGLSIQ